MVASLDYCFFCGVAVVDQEAHVRHQAHKLNVCQFLCNEQNAKSMRPSEEELKSAEVYISKIRSCMHAERVHPIGSIGKGTALRHRHDLDLAVVVREFDPNDPRTSVQRVAAQLSAKYVRVLRCEKHLAKVVFSNLSVDVVPTGEIDANSLASKPDVSGWRGAVALEHTRIVKQMKEWRKDVVRILKAWAWLVIPVGGLFLETITLSVPEGPKDDRIQRGVTSALKILASGRRSFPDPFLRSAIKDTRLTDSEWMRLEQYACRTLSIILASQTALIQQPDLLKGHTSHATFEPTAQWKEPHKVDNRGEYDDGLGRGSPCVLKRHTYDQAYSAVDITDRLKVIDKAKDIVARFNSTTRPSKRIYINEARVWAGPAADRQQYHHFNSNTGFQMPGHDLMAALSHFSYHITDGEAVLCDLQGGLYSNCYMLRAPTILSRCREFGPADLGQRGIDHFFSQHRCSSSCHPSWKRPGTARKIFKVCEGSSMVIDGQVHYGSGEVSPRQEAEIGSDSQREEADDDCKPPPTLLGDARALLLALLVLWTCLFVAKVVENFEN